MYVDGVHKYIHTLHRDDACRVRANVPHPRSTRHIHNCMYIEVCEYRYIQMVYVDKCTYLMVMMHDLFAVTQFAALNTVQRGGGLGSSTISKNLMSPTPRRKWYLTTGRRAH